MSFCFGGYCKGWRICLFKINSTVGESTKRNKKLGLTQCYSLMKFTSLGNRFTWKKRGRRFFECLKYFTLQTGRKHKRLFHLTAGISLMNLKNNFP